jgi:hypothetical protein
MEKYLLKKTQPKTTTETRPAETTTEITTNEQAYLNSLSPKELKSYEIAKTHLRTSFNLSKAQGYIKWTK